MKPAEWQPLTLRPPQPIPSPRAIRRPSCWPAAERTRQAGGCLLRLPSVLAVLAGCSRGRRRARARSAATIRAPDIGASLPGADFRVLREDDHLLAIDKDSGLLTAPGIGPAKADCLLARLRERGYPEVTHAAHRLDRDTSGILVFGRTKAAHRALSMAFERRRVEKTYEALVWEWPGEDAGEVDMPIGKVRAPGQPTRMAVVDDDASQVEGARPSRTSWIVLHRYTPDSDVGVRNGGARCTRVRLRPLTGRGRQLRLHMAALGHPLLGDMMHGEDTAAATASPRLCLHAASLRFPHPATEELILVTSPAAF